ncbi:hypothetical protein [Thermosyntropha sp.]|uniref:hypothetical protein n=1 Tax=Thermosyntropha sp. TaxID=2740820 RepID=UPI0025E63ABA|nr:hypothetical protein [Thermosyntropha sp.]MBO8158480.1 hypothetical protein [Thermosyntropha sp.]
MKTGRVGFFLLFIFFILCSSPSKLAVAEEDEKNSFPEYVFIISVDGLSYEGFASTSCNNIKHLASEGFMDEKSLALKIETVEAAQASLLTGCLPEEHKFITSHDKVEVESLFDVIKKQKKTVLVVDGSGGKLRTFAHSEEEYFMLDSMKSDNEVMAEAIKLFKERKPFFTFIYLNDCLENLLSLDEKEYYKSVKSFDQALSSFIAELRNEDIYYRSLIVVASPRSSSTSNFTPLIIHTPGCVESVRISGTTVLDIVPTVCKLTGLKTPYNAVGIPVYESLNIKKEERLYILEAQIKDLKAERIRLWTRLFDLQDELNRAYNRINSIKEEKQNIFNFAGEREKIIYDLQNRIKYERILGLSIFLLMLAGYWIEYKVLKKRFLLFK